MHRLTSTKVAYAYRYHIAVTIAASLLLLGVLFVPLQSSRTRNKTESTWPSAHHDSKEVNISMICSHVPFASPALDNISEARKRWGEALKPLTLRRVCLDGDAIVIHDPTLLESAEGGLAGSSSGLPEYDASTFVDFHRHASRHTHPLRPIYGKECRFNKLSIRFPSASEIKEAKFFSRCTMPVIIYQNWVSTFAEYFTYAPAWLWAMQNKVFLSEDGKVLDENLTAVIASCHNFPLAPYTRQLLQPYSRHPIESWSSFASSESSKANRIDTSQGSFRQCYDKVVLLGISEASWGNAYKSAQHTLQYYKARGQVPDMRGKLFSDNSPDVLRVLFEFRSPDGQPLHSSTQKIPPLQHLKLEDPSMAEEYQRSKHLYHLLDDVTGERLPMDESRFTKRPVYPGTRQVLNLQEILDECNNSSEWAREWLLALNKTRVECRAYSFSDLFEGMAVAQLTDVFISLHGSGGQKPAVLYITQYLNRLISNNFSRGTQGR